jgi:hypothetical protein
MSTLPDKPDLITQIKTNVPEFLLECDYWIPYYFQKKGNGKYTKPPCQGYAPKAGSPTLFLDKACEIGFPGIKMSSDHDLVAIDVDDNEAKLGRREFSLSLFSDEFKEFIQVTDSYMEYTPSKCGVRILFHCPDKHLIPGRPVLNPDDCIGGEMFASSGFVTITGDYIAGDGIKTISAEQLLRWTEPTTAEIVTFPKDHIKHPALQDIERALSVCKLNQSNQVKKAYQQVTNQPYSHYDYWLKILAACHNYALETGQMSQIAQMVVDWSKTDLEAFESEEDVLTKLGSFGKERNPVTYHTLFKFAKLLRFDWPKPAYVKGVATGNPLVNEFVNFEYLMRYHEIEIFHETMTSQFFVRCSEDLQTRFFNGDNLFGMAGPFPEKQMLSNLWVFAQANGYDNVTLSTISPLASTFIYKYSNEMSLLTLWLETPHEQLPDEFKEEGTDPALSNLDYLLSCLELTPGQSIDLVKKYFEAFFFEMMMPIYNPKRIRSTRSFMLILTGPENAYKSTFFEELLPHNLSRLFITSSKETLKGEKSQRDLLRSTISSALVIVDEVEILYNPKNASLFKTLVTSDRVDFTDIYRTDMQKAYKNAVLVGTTNKKRFAFEMDSNRRFAIVEVNSIDTDAMKKINWHFFYNQFVESGRKLMAMNIYPWKLSQETIAHQYKENELYRSSSNLEAYLKEVYDFTYTDFPHPMEIGSVQTDPHLVGIKEIMARVQMEFPRCKADIAEFKHMARQLSAKFSGTEGKQMNLKCKGYVKSGVFKAGQWTKYMFPPVKTEFLPENQKDFK